VVWGGGGGGVGCPLRTGSPVTAALQITARVLHAA